LTYGRSEGEYEKSLRGALHIYVRRSNLNALQGKSVAFLTLLNRDNNRKSSRFITQTNILFQLITFSSIIRDIFVRSFEFSFTQ